MKIFVSALVVAATIALPAAAGNPTTYAEFKQQLARDPSSCARAQAKLGLNKVMTTTALNDVCACLHSDEMLVPPWKIIERFNRGQLDRARALKEIETLGDESGQECLRRLMK